MRLGDPKVVRERADGERSRGGVEGIFGHHVSASLSLSMM